MSHMQFNKGVVKELFNELDSPMNKAKALAKQLGIEESELFYEEDPSDPDYIEFKDSYYDKYAFSCNRLFDVSGAPDREFESEERNHVKYLGNGEYEVDMIYYNGGADFSEMFSKFLEKQERGDAGIEPYFVRFRESNDNEGESWNFWLQLDGNEAELQKLQDALDNNDLEDAYSLNMTAVPESEVDILVKHSDSGYMTYENKVTGKFKMPEPKLDGDGLIANYEDANEYYFDTFYKGGIEDCFNDSTE